jgi:hypothetical protein
MKPTIVSVEYSEAGGALTSGAVMDFTAFEAEALKAALGHKGGGYLKTGVSVHFDTGETYACRLDLGDAESGFADGMRNRIEFHESVVGQQKLFEAPKRIRETQEELYALWVQMDFSPDLTWCTWEIQDLRQPVDTIFCTATTRH